MRAGNARWTARLALSLLIAVGLAACNGDESTETTDTTAATVRGEPTIDITMTDYAYAVSGPMIEGGTMKISNQGEEFHMMGVGKLKPGKTLAELQAALQSAGPPGGPGEGEGGETTTSSSGGTTTSSSGGTTTSSRGGATTTSPAGGTSTTAAGGGGAGEGEEGGERQDPTAEFVDEMGLPGNFMGPGQSADLTIPSLGTGTYALICFIPTEEEGTPHFAKGMINQFQVVAGPTPPPPTADVTYKLAPGEAIEGPATLAPGRHTLKFEAATGSEQLEPAIAKLDPGTTPAEIDQAFTEVFGDREAENSPPPPDDAPSRIPAEIVFAGFDLDKITTFYLATNFTAGEYGLVAEDTDAEDRPTPPKEYLEIEVG